VKKAVKYSQFHLDNNTFVGSLRAVGLPMAGCDGGVNIWGRSLEEFNGGKLFCEDRSGWVRLMKST
jgi:hypothetical protein